MPQELFVVLEVERVVFAELEVERDVCLMEQ